MNRYDRFVKKLKKELDKAQKLYNDKWKESLSMDDDEYQAFWKPYVEREMALSRLYRSICPYELGDAVGRDDDTIYTIEEFVQHCITGAFIDYDGFGYYVKDGRKSDVVINPSDITSGCYRTDFDSVIWFNK